MRPYSHLQVYTSTCRYYGLCSTLKIDSSHKIRIQYLLFLHGHEEEHYVLYVQMAKKFISLFTRHRDNVL